MADKNTEFPDASDEILPSSTGATEPNISPKDNDELHIEFEEKIEHSIEEKAKIEKLTAQFLANPSESEIVIPSQEINDEIIIPTPPVAPVSQPEPPKVTIPKPEPVVVEAPKEQKPKHVVPPKVKKPEPVREPKVKSQGGKFQKISVIIIIILLVIIGGLGTFIVLKSDSLSNSIPDLLTKLHLKEATTRVTKVKDTVRDSNVKSEAKENPVVVEDTIQPVIETQIPAQQVEIPQEIAAVDDKPNKASVVKPVIKEGKGESFSGRVVKKGKVPTPCWIVCYSNVKDEAVAIKTVMQISSKWRKSSYYWIPDYTPKGTKAFRVFLGPYKTKEQAEAVLPNAQKDKSDAFVLEVNE